MLTGDQIVEIILAIIGAIVSIVGMIVALETRRTANKIDVLRATIASLHAVIMSGNKPIE